MEPGGGGNLNLEAPLWWWTRQSERAPGNEHLADDARLVGAEVERLGVRHLGAACRLMLHGGAGAEPRHHRRMIPRLGARRDEVEGEALRAGTGIGVELEAVCLGEREVAGKRQEIEIVIVLADGGEREAALAP